MNSKNKIFYGMVFAILLCGIFAGNVSALKKVNVEVYPFDWDSSVSDIHLGRNLEFRLTLINVGDEKLPKGTNLYAALYYGECDLGKKLRHMSKKGNDIGELDIGYENRKTFSFKSMYKFLKPGEYCFKVDVYNSDYFQYGREIPFTVKPRFSAEIKSVELVFIGKKEYTKVTITNTCSETFDNTVKLVAGRYGYRLGLIYDFITTSKNLKGINPGETREILLSGYWSRISVTENGNQIAKKKN